MTGTFVEFCKRAGIVAGAALAVLTLGNTLAGFAQRVAMRPVMDAIAEERSARIEADSKLSRDRLDLIDVMLTPAGTERNHKLREIRRRWSKDR